MQNKKIKNRVTAHVVYVRTYPRLMDFFGFETDFELFFFFFGALMFITVRARLVGIRVTDETILGRVDRRSGGPGLMICLNAFPTTKNVFNDVVVVIASPQT